MIRTEKETIDGLEITVTQFAALRQAKLLARLGRTLGPTVGLAARSATGENPDKLLAEVMSMDLGGVIAMVFDRLVDTELEGLITATLAGTSVIHNEKKVDLSDKSSIDAVFSGRLVTLFKVMVFAIKVNFADFSEAVRERISRGRDEQASVAKEG